MPIFGIKPEKKTLLFDTYAWETHQRLQGSNWIKNPFTGGIKFEDGIVICEIKPVFPNFSIFGIVASVLGTLWWSAWFSIGVAFFLLISVPWWAGQFYFLMFKLGLKKKGEKTKLKYLGPTKIIEEVYFNGASGSPAIPAGAEKKESGPMVQGH